MSDYAVVNPATGETVKEYPTISDDDLRDAIGRADKASPRVERVRRRWRSARQLVRRVGEMHAEQRERLAEIIVREMGKPVEQALGELDFAAAIYEYYADNAPKLLADEDDRAARRRRLGDHPPQPLRRPARDHAVELPLLPGGALRRPEPGDRQHDPAQARAAVPGVGRGDAGDLHRGRLPGGRVHQHLRDQRADRVGHRRPARARRLADRLGARRRGGRRDRRAQPQEGRARAGRVGPVHPAQHRRPRHGGRERGRGARRQHRPVLQRGQAVHRGRRALRAVPGEVHRRHHGGRAGRPDEGRHRDRPAVVVDGDRAARGPAQARDRQGREARRRRRARGQLLQDHRPHRHRLRQPRPPRGVLRPGRAGLPRQGRGRRRSSSPTTRPTASART